MDIPVTRYLEHRSRSTQPSLAAFGLSGGSAGLLAPGASSCCTLGTSSSSCSCGMVGAAVDLVAA
jgi:hypothetical protein